LLHFQQSGSGDQRENSHLQTVEHPAEEGRDKNEISPVGRDRDGWARRGGSRENWKVRFRGHGSSDFRGIDQAGLKAESPKTAARIVNGIDSEGAEMGIKIKDRCDRSLIY
jgi:hypothetical protein